MTLHIVTSEEMEALGACLGRASPAGTIIYLSGELGSGKTTLVRGFVQSLGHQGPVKSPSYTLIEPYELSGLTIYHFDLYRLSNPDELEFLGARDYFTGQGICLVEWPERAAGRLPRADITATLCYAHTGRDVELTAHSKTGAKILALTESDMSL